MLSKTKILILSLVVVLIVTLLIVLFQKKIIKFEFFEDKVIPNEISISKDQDQGINEYITRPEINTGIDTQYINSKDIKTNNMHSNTLYNDTNIILGKNGNNKWILHAPNDNRKTLFVAPQIGNKWAWEKQVNINNQGSLTATNGYTTLKGGNLDIIGVIGGHISHGQVMVEIIFAVIQK